MPKATVTPASRSRAERITLDTELYRFSRHFQDRITLGDAAQGTVVLGENGSGKTSSLRTIARGFLERGDGRELCFASKPTNTTLGASWPQKRGARATW